MLIDSMLCFVFCRADEGLRRIVNEDCAVFLRLRRDLDFLVGIYITPIHN